MLNFILLIGIIAVILFQITSRISIKKSNLSKKFLVKDAMIPFEELVCFQHAKRIEDAFPIIIRSSQEYFPVNHTDSLLGIIKRSDFIHSLEILKESYVSSIAEKGFSHIDSEDSLEQAILKFKTLKDNILIVRKNDKDLGILIKDKIAEFTLLMNFRDKQKKVLDENDLMF